MSKNMLIISALTAMYTNNPSLQLMFPVLSEDLSFITFVKTIEKYKHYELNGVTPMHTFVNELGLERVIDNYCDYTTISGFIIDKLGRIPNQDDVLTFKNCIFTMIKVSNNKIELIDLKFNMEDLNDD